MNVTGTGIAVALAVVLALAFLFFGPALFSPFGAGAPATLDQNAMITMDTTQSGEPLPTTLTVTDEVVGTGAEATVGSTVSVQYVGMLPDGTVFDASANHGGQPFTFSLGGGQVIPGWDQGLVGMKVGGKRQLVIPPDMAYGANGVPGAIPPNATLIFDVELVEVR
ncbi:MAG TPA: FKBP-type peptidyl-prolyl cis-trans isomerase [Candidatus Paceibacterota bacterium]|nr:FKBP-type peptidyl-prolyl cis-trans isomerase [Candidatus Paceibacterota bacterium]